MRLRVLYHANCFDGCASAALFARWFTEKEASRLEEVSFFPVQHHQGDPFPPGAFDAAEVNACVDFRYSTSPRLHWWFDHHASAFQPASDKGAFDADRSGQKFWDPTAPSCTGFIARTLAGRFGWKREDTSELVTWADIIDAARFPSAAVAVRLEEPALRIMALLEATHDPEVPTRIIHGFARRPLAEIAGEPWVERALAPILDRHRKSLETVQRHARLDRGVVFIDLTDTSVDGANKFIAYDLFPDARYTVVVTRDARRAKVSVGSNPWARETRTHDISKLCERYGGGGHPVVGAVSLDPHRVDDARRIAGEIASALQDGRAS